MEKAQLLKIKEANLSHLSIQQKMQSIKNTFPDEFNKRTHFITKFIQELSSDLSCKVKGLNACVGGTFSHAIFVCECGKAVEYLQRKDILHGEHS